MSDSPFRIDLHVHSRLSGDSDADPEECVIAAIERGLHGIAFTEHYSYAASEPVEELAERYRGRLLIVRGVEFSAAEGHCLVFGVDTDALALAYEPVRELVRAVNREGGVVVPSHPYRMGSGIGDLALTLEGIAAIEGHNGCNHRSFNERALEAARRRRLPVTGGSDAHLPREVGSCHTVFRGPVSAARLVELLRAGACEAVDLRPAPRPR
jgi:predicted metal-dependent phosphoesterase TrpH